MKINLFYFSICCLLFSCQNDPPWQTSIFSKQIYYPLIEGKHLTKGYNTFVAHYENQEEAFKEGVKQYNFKHKSIHRDAIYKKGDLSQVVEVILKSTLPDKGFKVLDETYAQNKELYTVQIRYRNQLFSFQTSSIRQRLSIASIIQSLNKIAEQFFKDHIFVTANYPNNHITTFVFGEKTQLEDAIKEGFPCSVESQNWKELEKKFAFYPIIKMNSLPSKELIKEKIITQIAAWEKAKYKVPYLNEHQIQLLDLGEKGLWQLIINGKTVSLQYQVGQSLHCDHSPWGLVLTYCLLDNPEAKVVLEDPLNRRWMTAGREEFMKDIIEHLFYQE